MSPVEDTERSPASPLLPKPGTAKSPDNDNADHRRPSQISSSHVGKRSKFVKTCFNLSWILTGTIFQFGTLSLEFIALYNGWTPVVITIGTALAGLLSVMLFESRCQSQAMSHAMYVQGVRLQCRTQKLKFNPEFIDLVLPMAFLHFLGSLIPLRITKACITETGICHELPIIPAVTAAVTILLAQSVRIASRSQIAQSTQPGLAQAASSLQAPTKRTTMFIETPQQPCTKFSSVRYNPSNIVYRHSVFQSLVKEISKMWVFIKQLVNSPEGPHVILFSLGCFLMMRFQLTISMTSLLIIHSALSVLSKHLLDSPAAKVLLHNHQLIFEFHLYLVELVIALIFFFLPFIQFFVGSLFFLRDVPMKVTAKSDRKLAQILAISLCVLIRHLSLILNNRMLRFPQADQKRVHFFGAAPEEWESQTFQPTTTQTNQYASRISPLFEKAGLRKFRWVQFGGLALWYIISLLDHEFLILMFDYLGSFDFAYIMKERKNFFSAAKLQRVVQKDPRVNVTVSFFSCVLILVGFFHSVIVRNK